MSAAAPDVLVRPTPVSRLWDRELSHYPKTGPRMVSLAIVVLTTIILYYQFYLAGSLAAGTAGKNGIIPDLHMSFVYYVNISVIGYVFGAAASFAAGIADRYGRANIVTIGLLITGLLCLIGIPNAHSKVAFGVVFILIGAVEGVILVATPALIRDFSPQLGRASAMGFWTLGPVLGSLVVSIVVSNSSVTTPWRNQYAVCGIVGIVVFLIALFGLRELTPSLRDQLMVSSRDRALIEARAKGLDIEASLKKPFRQMLKLDVIGSAFAISVFLIIYYVAVGFFPVFFQTVFGYSQSEANGLGNYFWAFDAGALLVIGYLSDLVRVRKPFMVIGAIGAIVFTAIFATKATDPHTSHATFVLLLTFMAISLGVAYAPWMASFTETVERRNPALTATGLAVWGLVIRIVIAVSVFFVPHVVNTVTTLVDDGAPVSAAQADVNANHPGLIKALQANPTVVADVSKYGAQYGAQLATAAKIPPVTLAALQANGNDQTAQAQAISSISGVSVADVVTVATLQATHGPALAAGQALDPATAATLLLDPTDQQAAVKAVGEVVAKLHLTPAEAQSRLQELATIPTSQLVTVQNEGSKVQAGAAQLTALSKVPANVTTLFGKTAPAALGAKNFAALTNTSDKKLQADLAILSSPTGARVAAAASSSPKQWRNYFWIAVGGEVVFIPLIFVMAGFWDPRKAKKQEEDHEAWVEAELAKLGRDEAAPA